MQSRANVLMTSLREFIAQPDYPTLILNARDADLVYPNRALASFDREDEQTYYVLLRLRALDANHERIFSAIHDKGRVFRSKEELAELVDGHDITRAEFLAAFDSNETRRAMNEAARLTQAYSITSVPTIVVGDRWVILPDVPRRDTLPVATQLIEKLRAERAGSAAPN